MRKYFSIGFWFYVFSDLSFCDDFKHKLEVIWCRLRGHPNGMVFYTGPTAQEPNYSCKDCGEEIGF